MGDLLLDGMLDFSGNLTLEADGGKVKVGGLEVLIELTEGMAPPVIMPPPPASPTDMGTKVVIINSLNKTVKTAKGPIVTTGMVMQGSGSVWPGMVLPSKGNTSMVSVNHLAMNVQGDQAIIFPSGGMANFDNSGQ